MMTQINPFTGAIIQSSQVPPHQVSEKQRQIRRLQNLSKNVALQGDRLEHQVESADAAHPAGDQDGSRKQGHGSSAQHSDTPEEGSGPHVDLTA